MSKFTDTAGREWNLKLDWDLHEQVKAREGVMLLEVGDNNCELLARLHTDLRLLVDILWILCEEQAPALGVVDDDKMPATRKFAKGLGGDVLESAAAALVEAVIDFFPNQAKRDGLTALMAKARAASDLMTQVAIEKISQLNAQQLAQSCIEAAGSSQPLLESSLGGTRLAN